MSSGNDAVTLKAVLAFIKLKFGKIALRAGVSFGIVELAIILLYALLPRDTTQYEQCGTQGVQDNQYSRRCRGDGFWEDVNYGQCVCDAETVDEISWESTPMDEAAWIQCGSGSKARICLPGGIWDSNVADYNCMCTADMEWNPTPAGVQVELPCPDNPEKVQTRRCRNDGVWEDVNSIGCY